MENLSMNKFQKSAIETADQKAILGGAKTSWTDTKGGSGSDTYDECSGCYDFDDIGVVCP